METSGERFFHFLVNANDGMEYWQNIVIVARDVATARARLETYLIASGGALIEIDEEETKEVDLGNVPAAWVKNALPDLGLAAAGGRILVDEQL